MGRLFRAGSAATVAAVLVCLLGGCGSTDRSATDSPATGSNAPSASPSPDPLELEPGHPLPPAHQRLVRCLHASTVPAEGEPSHTPSIAPSLPDPPADVRPHFWLPLFVECPPATPLLGDAPQPEEQPGG